MIAVVMMMFSLQAMAYDFSYTYQGNMLCYDITSESTVKVVPDYYTDSIVNIPSSVTHNGRTYSVTGIGAEAFAGSVMLSVVTIPNSVIYIYRKSSLRRLQWFDFGYYS